MSKYFYCRKCKKRTRRNVRIKEQSYCSANLCQQARKNDWERNKKRIDPSYRQRRKAQRDASLKRKEAAMPTSDAIVRAIKNTQKRTRYFNTPVTF